MAPQEYSSRAPPAESKHSSYDSPFHGLPPEDYDVSASEVDSDNQPIMSHLLRRSKSFTDTQLTNDLQPSSRRRSFFSKRKLKPFKDPPTPSITTPGRSLSGLLSSPSHARTSEPNSKRPTGSKRADSKSTKARGDSDTDAPATKPKSARWWIWGGSSKALKPDGKVLLPQVAGSPSGKEAGNSSRPSSLDVPGQSAHTNGVAAVAQPSPLMQSGCMSMFSTAAAQPEKPLSEVQWTGRSSASPAPPSPSSSRPHHSAGCIHTVTSHCVAKLPSFPQCIPAVSVTRQVAL